MSPGRPIRSLGPRPRAAGARRYRVWWLEGRAEAVVAPRRWRRAGSAGRGGLGAALAGGFCVLWADTLALCLLASVLFLLTGTRRWAEQRPRRLRRLGARPGPWVWAIDAEAAVCTARIRAGLPEVLDQLRRTPSMRIQSPSCSQRRSSNQAA
jgi:hypothetical protein